MNGTIKDAEQMPEGIRPLDMAISALKNAIEDKVSRLKLKAYDYRPDISMRELRPELNLFDIYGRIVFKKKEVCILSKTFK